MPASRRKRLAALAFLLSLLAISGRATATELIFPGIQPKVSAGAGQTVTRGSDSLFYNPANLIYSKFIEPYLDVSFAKVTYTYQHIDADQYDPVVVDVTAPPVTAGLSFRPVPAFALGVAFLPTGTGAVQEVKNVPLEVTEGSYKICNIVTKNEGSKIAAGAAVRFGFPFTLGAGLIHTSEKTQLLVTKEEDEEPFIDALYGGSSNQFIGGIRSELVDRALVVALSYKTAVTKTYSGDYLLDLGQEDADYQPFEGKGYTPAAIGFGLETKLGDSFGLFLDYVREQWSGGRTVVKRGIGSTDPPQIDLKDTNNIVGGLKLWVAKKHMLTGAVGVHGGNMGFGTEEEHDDEGDATAKKPAPKAKLADDEDSDKPEKVGGVSFGNLDAIPRTIFSAGYRAKLTGTGYLELGFEYQTGKLEVPEYFAQHGSYSLSVLLLSAGVAFGF